MSKPDLQSHNLQLIRDALDSYAEQMKIDLKDNPFVEELKGCNSPEAILQLLEKNRDDFKGYRDKDRKFVDCLKPVVKFVHAFSRTLGEAVSLVSAERSLFYSLCIYSSTRFRSILQSSSSLASTSSSLCVVPFVLLTSPNILSQAGG